MNSICLGAREETNEMKAACVVVVCLLGIGSSMPRETNSSIDETGGSSSDRDDNINALASTLEPRKHKHYHDLFLRKFQELTTRATLGEDISSKLKIN